MYVSIYQTLRGNGFSYKEFSILAIFSKEENPCVFEIWLFWMAVIGSLAVLYGRYWKLRPNIPKCENIEYFKTWTYVEQIQNLFIEQRLNGCKKTLLTLVQKWSKVDFQNLELVVCTSFSCRNITVFGSYQFLGKFFLGFSWWILCRD